MLHKAWSSIEQVPYCFLRSSVKFQGHTALKIIKFDPNWAFPDSNSSLNSPMVTEWCTKLEVAWKRCHIVFQGNTSNCKVTRLKKLSILTQIGCFWTRTPVWIHQWLWNDAQSLRGALLFFKVIRQISRSHGEKKLSILTRVERLRTVTPVWIHWWLWNDAQSLTQYRRGALLFFSCDQAAYWMVLSVCLSVCLPVTPFSLCSHHRIIMKFYGVITNDQSKVHAKGQGQGHRGHNPT